MNKMTLLLLGLVLLAGCSKSNANRSKEFTHTGCASDTRSAETRAGWFGDDPSLLKLKYEDGGLRVTRTNATMNCSINSGGIVCDVSVKGNVISYFVYEKDGPTANCICPVEEMSSVVTGLQEGQEYTLEYRCYQSANVSFTFKKSLNKIIDLDTD